ncbi:MAG: hypothetical protein ABI156_15620 [Caldimonas sp.]
MNKKQLTETDIRVATGGREQVRIAAEEEKPSPLAARNPSFP